MALDVVGCLVLTLGDLLRQRTPESGRMPIGKRSMLSDGQRTLTGPVESDGRSVQRCKPLGPIISERSMTVKQVCDSY